MASVRPVELAPDAATAQRSRAERSKLRRELGRLDAICLLIAAIVVPDTLGAVATGGAQTLVWLAVVADRLTGLTGFIDALATVFSVYGPWEGLVGGVTALALVWIVVANGLTWVMASSRTQAAASLDGVGPAALGRVSARTGTPVAATLTSGLVATATTLAATALATGWSAVALAAALWPGLGTPNPDVHLPDGFDGQRLTFTLAQLVPLALVLLSAFLLARPGRLTARARTR